MHVLQVIEQYVKKYIYRQCNAELCAPASLTTVE